VPLSLAWISRLQSIDLKSIDLNRLAWTGEYQPKPAIRRACE
jgi:hypothetical protein